jgi:hypothetical protein
MGTTLSLLDPRLTGLRKVAVNGFEKSLIFYLPRPDGVSDFKHDHGFDRV